MSLSLKEKTALVTGGSRGIGRAIGEKLAAEGATVIINYARNEQLAQEVVKAISARGGRAGSFSRCRRPAAGSATAVASWSFRRAVRKCISPTCRFISEVKGPLSNSLAHYPANWVHAMLPSTFCLQDLRIRICSPRSIALTVPACRLSIA